MTALVGPDPEVKSALGAKLMPPPGMVGRGVKVRVGVKMGVMVAVGVLVEVDTGVVVDKRVA